MIWSPAVRPSGPIGEQPCSTRQPPLCGLHCAPNLLRSLSEANTEVGAVLGMTPPHMALAVHVGRALWRALHIYSQEVWTRARP